MMKKALAIGGIVFSVLLLVGCGMKAKNDGNELQVNAPGVDVNIKDGNVEVNTPDASVKAGGNGVEVDTSANGKSSLVKKRNVVLVMDASGSMNAMLDGKTKIDIAKESAGMLVEKMKDSVNLGVISYGHIGGNTQAEKALSCNGIEEIYYFGPVNSKLVKSKINNLPAKGWTPIAKSLEKAKEILVKYPDEQNEILLVSDGEETCGGDPVALAKEVCAAGIRVDVIGFNVSGVAETQLKNISIGGCGAYASVDNYNDFGVIIEGNGLHLQAPGAIIDIQGGIVKVDTADTMIEAGPNGVNVKTDEVEVSADGSVNVNIPGTPNINY